VKIALVSAAWAPQVNGAARTLAALQDGLNAAGHQVLTLTPDLFAAVRSSELFVAFGRPAPADDARFQHHFLRMYRRRYRLEHLGRRRHEAE